MNGHYKYIRAYTHDAPLLLRKHFHYSTLLKGDFELRLAGERIPYNPNPKLLGITLDESLCFKKNAEKIKEKCMIRLDIIKILSHKTELDWKLETEQRNLNLAIPLANWLYHRVFFLYNLRNIHLHTKLFAINPESSH